MAGVSIKMEQLNTVINEIKRRDEAIRTLMENKKGCEQEFKEARGLYTIFASISDGSDSKELEKDNENIWYAKQKRDQCIAHLDSQIALNKEWRNSLIELKKTLEKDIYPMRGGKRRSSKRKLKSRRRVSLIKKARK